MSLDTLLGLTVQCHEMFWHPLFGSFHSDDQTTLQTIEKSDRLWGFPNLGKNENIRNLTGQKGVLSC